MAEQHNEFVGKADNAVQIGQVHGDVVIKGTSAKKEMKRSTFMTLGAIGLGAVLGVPAIVFSIWGSASDEDTYDQAVRRLADANLATRTDAIKELGGIARNDPRRHRAVMERLAEFIRQHSPAELTEDVLTRNQNKNPESDVLEAVATIRDREKSQDNGLVLDLSRANLPETNWQGAHLSGAKFHKANLTDAHLEGATLHRTEFDGACLNGARLDGAQALGARFPAANLWSAALNGTVLTGADMSAHIGELEVKGTDLRATNNLPPRGIDELTGRQRYLTDDRTLFP